MVQKEERKTDR